LNKQYNYLELTKRKKMSYINLTPHKIVLNDGRSFLPHGTIARIEDTFTEFDGDFVSLERGNIVNLPNPSEKGTIFIVSGLVKGATDRLDVVSPSTGHPTTIRNDKGHIVSVKGFVR
jgi:hypothetical protein